MRDAAKLEWQRLKNRCLWSWHGLCEVWRTEASFRFWTVINLISASFAILLDLGGTARGLILALGLLILAVELVNSAIERAIDYISAQNHPLAKSAKDAGSAGVAMTACAAGVAWVCVLIERFG